MLDYKGKKENTRRIIYILGSVLVAFGVLVVLLTSLSSSATAHATTASITARTDEVTADRWRILADMQTGRGDPGVVALNNKIHVVSGYYSPGYGYSSSQEIYDPQTNTWQRVWGFPYPRSDMVAETVDDKIYAIGGWNVDLGGVQGSNHMYDPALGIWITMTSMITSVSGAAGIVVSDTIYVLGGFDGTDNTRHVQIYDPASNSWSAGTPMNTSRSEFGAVILDGKIYAIGGTNNIDNVEIYDLATNLWNTGQSLPDTRFFMSVVERNENIYVIGGTDDPASGIVTNTTFIYDPTSDFWTTGVPMPTARSAIGGAVLDDIIYTIGGTGSPDAGTANEAYGNFEIIPSHTQIVMDKPNPSRSYQPVTVGIMVTSALDIPTGIVTVTTNANNSECSIQLMNGMGSCEIGYVDPGIYSITATYGGDDFHSSSIDSKDHEVIKAETTTSIISHDPDPSLEGQPVSITFEVTSTYGLPTGSVTVTVSNGELSCSDDLAEGDGSCAITLESQGAYTITATYSGDLYFSPSLDATSHLVVDFLKMFIPIILRFQ